MATLSITKAWNEAVAFVQRESRLVLPIAFLLVSLPGAALQHAMPTPEPGTVPDLDAFMRDLRPVLIFMPFAAILNLVGTIALSFLAIRPGRTVAEALQRGVRRFIHLLLAWLLLGLVAAIPMFAIFAVAAALGSDRAVGVVLLLLLLYLVLILAAAIRLILTTPVCAAEDGGPIALIMRSWALTRGHFAKLLGFVILFWVAALVALFAFSIMVGIIVAIAAGPPLPGSTGAFVVLLLTAVPQAIVSCLFTTMVGRIYVQLSGAGPDSVFA